MTISDGSSELDNMKVDPAAALPAELFHKILSYLDVDDLAKSTRVNISWNQLGTDGILWQSLCRVRWQGKRYMRRVFKVGTPHTSIPTQENNSGGRPPKNGNGHTDKSNLNPNAPRPLNPRLSSHIGNSLYSSPLLLIQYTNGISSYNYPIFEANHTLIQPDIFPEPLTWNLLPGGYFFVTRIPPLYISRNRSTWA
jgi:F-box-like